MGDTVILQDDARFYLLEEPGDCATRPYFTPLVHITIASLNGTGPINLPLNHLPSGHHLSGFPRALWVRAIAGDKHPGWSHRADGIDDLLGSVGAKPSEEEDRSIETHRC